MQPEHQSESHFSPFSSSVSSCKDRARTRSILLHTDLPDEFQISVATTEEDWAQALALVHRSYLSRSLVKEADAPYYATPLHLRAPLTLIQAKLGTSIMGTAGLVKNSADGFPLEKVFQVPFLEPLRSRCAEITGLAISSKIQIPGGLVFPLFKYLYQFSTQTLDVDYLLIAVHPGHIRFYEQLLLFDRLSAKAVSGPEYMEGAPAIPAILDLKRATERVKEMYHGENPERNLYSYMHELKLPNLVYPETYQMGCPEGDLREHLRIKLGMES